MRSILLAALVLVSACSTHGSIQTAHTVGKGQFQGAIEPGVIVIPDATGGSPVGPMLSVAGRYGISDRFDLGARVGTGVYEVNAKLMFTDAEGTVVSIAPDATGLAALGDQVAAAYVRVRTPILIGVPVGEDQLVFGPNWIYIYGGLDFFGSGGQAFATGPGAQIAYSAKLGDAFRLHPEIAIHVPTLFSGADTEDVFAPATGRGDVLIGVNLGLLFGGR